MFQYMEARLDRTQAPLVNSFHLQTFKAQDLLQHHHKHTSLVCLLLDNLEKLEDVSL
jgi:hypothetical protein